MLHYTNAEEFCQERLHHFTYGGSIFSALFITPNPRRCQEAKVPAEGDGGDFNFQPDDWREADGGGEGRHQTAMAGREQMRGREGVMRPVKIK